MNILTREQFLNSDDRPVKVFTSEIWGGDLKYRAPDQNDRAWARKVSLVKNDKGKLEVDNELLEANIIIRCVVEPPLKEEDASALMARNALEFRRLLKAIIGDSLNP